MFKCCCWTFGFVKNTKFNEAYEIAKEHILSGKAFKHLKAIQNG